MRLWFGTGTAAAMQAVGCAMQGCSVPGKEGWPQSLSGTGAPAMCSGCFPPALPWPRGLAVCSAGCDNSSRVLEPAGLEGPAWSWWAGKAQVSIIPKLWEPWSQVISYCRELQSDAWKRWDVLGSWLSQPRDSQALGMRCCTVLHCAEWCRAVLYRAICCCAICCCAMWCCVMPCCATLCHVMLCHMVPCHMVLHRAM